jgi:hypothetical protein
MAAAAWVLMARQGVGTYAMGVSSEAIRGFVRGNHKCHQRQSEVSSEALRGFIRGTQSGTCAMGVATRVAH